MDRDTEFLGWILYTKEESIRNQAYIEFYRRHGRRYGLAIELVIYQPTEGLGRLELEKAKPDFVINRTRDYRIAERLENLGIRVFNSSQVAKLGNDKGKAYQFMQRQWIPILPMSIGLGETTDYPVVVKSRRGHGGTEVFLFREKAEWKNWKKAHSQIVAEDYLTQKAASDLGRDVRVYVVGGRVVQAVLRMSETDFRSNYSLGGTVRLYELKPKEKELAEQILLALKKETCEIGMVGIDFVFDHGEMIFNEIEDMVGARMLYSLTDYDIVKEYVKYIREEMVHGQFV